MKCDRVDCEEEAYWQPIFRVSPDGEHYADGAANLNVCNKHKNEMVIDDVIDDDGWRQIVGGFLAAGRAEPIRKLTKLEWQPIIR